MFRTFYLPCLLTRRMKAQGVTTESVTPRVVVSDLGPMNNQVRLAQYRRKKAILALNPEAIFPLEVYA